MSARPDDAVEPASYTVDELAAATGMTVRTTRYYAGLGLLPPPERRGRMAYYGEQHRARLELIQELQAHGFTLAAIERYLDRVPLDASAEDLALQRVMLTSWVDRRRESLTRRQLQARAGRPLTDHDVEQLVATAAVERSGDRFEVLPAFDVAMKLMELDLPADSLMAAAEAINSHMDALADELTVILRERILLPFRSQPHTEPEKARMEQTMGRLRTLTLEAVVAGFRRAANRVITRSFDDPASP